MRKLVIICAFIFCVACKTEEKQTVEISCGQCQFGLTSQDGGDLAVRLNGKAYFVDGADIDDFGDAHDEQTGFCEVVRKAEVTGNVEDNRFKVSSVKLID